jgi:hypothetical protein
MSEKMQLYQRLMDSAVGQTIMFPFEEDQVLSLSKWIQPKTIRVEWVTKAIGHPFVSVLASYLPKVPFECNAQTNVGPDRKKLPPKYHPENIKLLIEHINLICYDRSKSEPMQYSNLVGQITQRVWDGMIQFFYAKNVNQYLAAPMLHLEELLQAFTLWSDFAFGLIYEAKLKSKGEENANSEFFLPYKFNHIVKDLEAIFLDHYKFGESKVAKKTKATIAVGVAKDIEAHIYSFLERKIPEFRIKTTKTMPYNISVCQTIKTIIDISLQLNHVSSKTVDALKVLTEYLTTTNDKHDSDLWKASFDCFNSMSIDDMLRLEGSRLCNFIFWEYSVLDSFYRITIDDFYDANKVNFLEEYQDTMFSLWKSDMTPDIYKWLKIKTVISQYKAQNKVDPCKPAFILKKKLEGIDQMITFCPSVLSEIGIQQLCLNYRPSVFFDVVMKEYGNAQSKLYGRGIFNSSATSVLPRLIIPFLRLKSLTNEQKSFMVRSCRDCLLDKNEPLERKMQAAVWLGEGDIANVDQINEIYLSLFTAPTGTDPVLSEPIVKKNLLVGLLYRVNEYEKALEIIFSTTILQDRDVNVYLIDGLIRFSDIIGDPFIRALRKLISTSEGLFKLGVAATKSLVRLIVRSRNSVDLLLLFWKQYRNYHITVSCYILSTMCELLNSEMINREPIWDALLMFVQDNKTLDVNNYPLFEVLCSQQLAPSLLDPIYIDFRGFNSCLSQFNISCSNIVVKEVADRYFNTILHPLSKKEFDNQSFITEKLLAMTISSFLGWFGMDDSINGRIIQSVLDFGEHASIPFSKDGEMSFLYEIVSGLYQFVSRCAQYYELLNQYRLPTRLEYLSITDIFQSFIETVFKSSKLESKSEALVYSNMCKAEWIFNLTGMKRRIFDQTDENEVLQKKQVHELIGRVYSQISSLK